MNTSKKNFYCEKSCASRGFVKSGQKIKKNQKNFKKSIDKLKVL